MFKVNIYLLQWRK